MASWIARPCGPGHPAVAYLYSEGRKSEHSSRPLIHRASAACSWWDLETVSRSLGRRVRADIIVNHLREQKYLGSVVPEMCVMLDSTASYAESAQYDFSHGLQEIHMSL
jgi:hypothetical protein